MPLSVIRDKDKSKIRNEERLAPWAKIVKPLQLIILPELSVFVFCTLLPLLFCLNAAGGAAAHAQAESAAKRGAASSYSGRGTGSSSYASTTMTRRLDPNFTEWVQSDRCHISRLRYLVCGSLSVLIWVWVLAREAGILVIVWYYCNIENQNPTAGTVVVCIFGFLWAMSGFAVVMFFILPVPFIWLASFLCCRPPKSCAVGTLDASGFLLGIPATFDGVYVQYSGWEMWTDHHDVSYEARVR